MYDLTGLAAVLGLGVGGFAAADPEPEGFLGVERGLTKGGGLVPNSPLGLTRGLGSA
jgi:hypothetical protein